ncbi:MAG: hypothetical protein ACP5I2_04730 [Fervidicoccaceae archaeon]|nr:MAG: hypothetical protein C0179_02590 [Fervidicoccus sp.]
MNQKYSRKDCWEACLSYYKEIFLASDDEAEEICEETYYKENEDEALILKKKAIKEPALAMH